MEFQRLILLNDRSVTTDQKQQPYFAMLLPFTYFTPGLHLPPASEGFITSEGSNSLSCNRMVIILTQQI
jgi:hypothetical protein